MRIRPPFPQNGGPIHRVRTHSLLRVQHTAVSIYRCICTETELTEKGNFSLCAANGKRKFVLLGQQMITLFDTCWFQQASPIYAIWSHCFHATDRHNFVSVRSSQTWNRFNSNVLRVFSLHCDVTLSEVNLQEVKKHKRKGIASRHSSCTGKSSQKTNQNIAPTPAKGSRIAPGRLESERNSAPGSWVNPRSAWQRGIKGRLLSVCRVAEPETLNTVPVSTFYLNTVPVPVPALVPGHIHAYTYMYIYIYVYVFVNVYIY